MDEGASSVITYVGSGWVRKTQKRSARVQKARKAKRNSVEVQLQLQTWAAEHLTPAAGYTHLFSPVPRASVEPHSYEMQIVNVGSDPWFLTSLPVEYRAELTTFQAAFTVATGYELHDMEFFPQPDGRVAVLDFDQCRSLKS